MYFRRFLSERAERGRPSVATLLSGEFLKRGSVGVKIPQLQILLFIDFSKCTGNWLEGLPARERTKWSAFADRWQKSIVRWLSSFSCKALDLGRAADDPLRTLLAGAGRNEMGRRRRPLPKKRPLRDPVPSRCARRAIGCHSQMPPPFFRSWHQLEIRRHAKNLNWRIGDFFDDFLSLFIVMVTTFVANLLYCDLQTCVQLEDIGESFRMSLWSPRTDSSALPIKSGRPNVTMKARVNVASSSSRLLSPRFATGIFRH